MAELEEKFTAVPVHAVAGAAEKGLVRCRADDAVFKLACAELCRGKQKAIIVSPYKIRSAMNIISGIVTGSSRFDCSTLLLAISGERS